MTLSESTTDSSSPLCCSLRLFPSVPARGFFLGSVVITIFRDPSVSPLPGRPELTLTEQGPWRYSRCCPLGSSETTFRDTSSSVQLSTLNSSLWSAGNSRCGCERLNFANASICNSEISRSCGIFARIASHTVTSPLIGVRWFRSSSDLSALITACESLVISARPFSPGRSAIFVGKSMNISVQKMLVE